ncbi:heme lyase CcmF/NrfE family subunit [Allosaccharopolyspora coralli]|uniref:Heme lyase CcmF/NrfE family subunit n=1 Tax=Allosaccharopolyspora coralli TaxID=2665642 RepID=A0A5Q3Q7D3_9PSEU|nr:cytochrome c-type biogenesis CcmF C-terminal domain-containing protein [Allosaccharopolyspora coralli]QGK70253.1 heme lyase CcmF/NrfE family subunit [Allosaccharopolyspora coralli]
MSTLVPAAGWVGSFLGVAASLALAWTGFRAQYKPGALRRNQLVVPVWCMVAGAALSMLALEIALLTDNFAVSYVAETHSRDTSWLFTITTAWSALGGSIVLWALVLAGYTAVVLRGVRTTDDRLGVGALGVMGIVAAFFFGLVTTVANPFRILINPPPNGPGPNPLLQENILVAFHPPMLYLGFVGFTVPFAFAMSALLIRQGGIDWLRRTRRANLVAWSFLTGATFLGAWWAYEVLGWGGYWAWDPVENAALLPWLTGTAFIHSAAVQIKRGMLQAWNFVLVLATFALTILGTFLTRSGVVSSVHSFTESGVGPAFLGLLLVVLVAGFGLFAARGERLASLSRPESLASREGAFLVNNLLLSLFAFVVLTGTVYPIVVEALTGNQVSVGRPFFDRMAVPLGFGLLLAMGVGPILPYRHAAPGVVWQRLRYPLVVASLTAAVLVAAGARSPGLVAVVFLATVIVGSTLRQLAVSMPQRSLPGFLRLVRGQRAYWGGQLAHLGVAGVVVVIAVTGAFGERSTVTLQRGEATEFAGYQVTFEATQEYSAPNREVTEPRISFRDDGTVAHVATPRVSSFRNQEQAVGTPSVWSGPTQDVYVSLADLQPDQVTLNLYRYPLMVWMWVAGAVMAAGGLWALGFGRRRSQGSDGRHAERSDEVVSRA